MDDLQLKERLPTMLPPGTMSYRRKRECTAGPFPPPPPCLERPLLACLTLCLYSPDTSRDTHCLQRLPVPQAPVRRRTPMLGLRRGPVRLCVLVCGAICVVHVRA